MKEKETRWKTSLLLLSIYLCLFIFLKGCGTGEKGIPDPPEPLSDLPPISDKLVARIYFDATLSMQGFVVPGSTHYTRICPYLESVIRSGWNTETVDFFRFGEQVEDIDRDTYLQVEYESFYQTDIGVKTYIEKVIEKEYPLVNPQIEASGTREDTTEIDVNTPPIDAAEADSTENQLVVIVTDLFQDNGDINRLLPELKEKCIKKGVDIGLFGLRSQFDGTVYDIGIGVESSMRYRGIRPFYLLVLGKHADIAHYFNKLIASGFSEAETIIFSRYLVSPLLSFDGATINEVMNLNGTSYVSPDPRLKQYEIRGDSDPAKISVVSEYKLLPHVMPFDSDTPEVSAIAKHAPGGETERYPEAEDGLKVKPTLSKNEHGYQLSIDFSLASQDLESAVYLYEVTLLPGIDSYRTPDWCSDWDMGRARDGAKTLNLVNFVRDLSQVTVRRHKPKIAQFHCYIGKR